MLISFGKKKHLSIKTEGRDIENVWWSCLDSFDESEDSMEYTNNTYLR